MTGQGFDVDMNPTEAAGLASTLTMPVWAYVVVVLTAATIGYLVAHLSGHRVSRAQELLAARQYDRYRRLTDERRAVLSTLDASRSRGLMGMVEVTDVWDAMGVRPPARSYPPVRQTYDAPLHPSAPESAPEVVSLTGMLRRKRRSHPGKQVANDHDN